MHARCQWQAYCARATTIRCRPRRPGRQFHKTTVSRQSSQSSANGATQGASGSNQRDDGGEVVKDSVGRDKSAESENSPDSKFRAIAEKAATLSQELDRWSGLTGNASTEKVITLRDRLLQVRQEAVDSASQLERLNRRSGRLLRRGRRPTVQPEEIALPKWFLERNIRLHEELRHMTSADCVSAQGAIKLLFEEEASENVTLRYLDLFAHFAGSLAVAEAKGRQLFSNFKSHLALYCQNDDSLESLASLVQVIAVQFDADFIRLDAQDVAELAAECAVADNLFPQNNIYGLGYDTYDRDQHTENVEEDSGDDDHDTPDLGSSSTKPQGIVVLKDIPLPRDLGRGITSLLQGQGFLPRDMNSTYRSMPPNILGSTSMGAVLTTPGSDADSLGALLEAVVDAAQRKRAGADAGKIAAWRKEPAAPSQVLHTWAAGTVRVALKSLLNSTATIEQRKAGPDDRARPFALDKIHKRTIIFLPDFMDISASPTGLRVVSFLEDIVQQRRNAGEEIILVGATDALDLEDETPEEAQRRLTLESESSRFRAMLVPLTPIGVSRVGSDQKTAGMTSEKNEGSVSHLPEARRNVQINYRNLGHMLNQLYPGRCELDRFSPSKSNRPYLSHRILRQDEVQSVALTAIGLQRLQATTGAAATGTLEEQHVEAALGLLTSIYGFGDRPLEEEEEEEETAKSTSQASTKQDKPGSDSERERRISSIRQSANRYEKRLLNAVVPPKKIRITFDDVHVAKETIEALRTLTSLSLQRPEAFQYGVLKTDTIPGLLLYGPPGTGKTMLAKAVAKESGTTVLNVSGSDINQMYVGESEKVVKAIFSLARKLSPCIVFIDEADSVFAARSSGSMGRSTSHRDTINQFLQEWDGIEDVNVFLMVATNRPFDLDDAVLRRLPRRLLVDLPQKDDREAILRIHLKDEELDSSVSLSALAGQTPFYSGSDLKNLAVAAALAAVREENDNKAQSANPEGYEYPEKRVLRKEHFEKAKMEIGASISEDMKSLAAIRKFDEEFGSGSKRKKAAWGFVPVESGENAVRVRPG